MLVSASKSGPQLIKLGYDFATLEECTMTLLGSVNEVLVRTGFSARGKIYITDGLTIN